MTLHRRFKGMVFHDEASTASSKVVHVNQLTVRGLDYSLAEHIRRLAKRDGTSLNQAALKLLRKGVGLADPSHRPDTVGSSLHHLIGSWSADAASELDATPEEFEVIDEAAWR